MGCDPFCGSLVPHIKKKKTELQLNLVETDRESARRKEACFSLAENKYFNALLEVSNIQKSYLLAKCTLSFVLSKLHTNSNKT